MVMRIGSREAVRKKPQLAACANCPEADNCPHANHYTRDGGCVRHPCPGFKSRDTSAIESAIRAKNRKQFFGSGHERLALTDVEIAMALGQSDVESLERQVPFRIGVRGMVYIADGVGILKPGGKYLRRIYEPKGAKSLMYEMKRRIVELQYPDVEFYEIPD